MTSLLLLAAAKANRIPSQAKPFDESGLKLAKLGPIPKTIPTLEGLFTLVYRLTITDVRTKAMREAIVSARANEVAKEVDEDRKSQTEADAEMAALRRPPKPRTETITLAYDGAKLLYEDRPDGGADPRPIVNLFDGTHTYFFRPRVPGGKQGTQASRQDGTVQYWTSNAPCIGPSFPFFPLVRGDEILILAGVDDKPSYRPFGGIETGHGGVARLIRIGRFDPQDTIVLSKWTPCTERSSPARSSGPGGHSLPSMARRTFSSLKGDTRTPSSPPFRPQNPNGSIPIPILPTETSSSSTEAERG